LGAGFSSEGKQDLTIPHIRLHQHEGTDEKLLTGLFKRVGAAIRGRTVVDDDLMDEIEEALIQADVNVNLALEIVEHLRERAEKQHITDPEGLFALLRGEVKNILKPAERSLNTGVSAPTTFLVLGVNGVGKTTTIAKIANWYRSAGNQVLIAAADTFRAAAIEQLEEWARRANCELVRQQQGSDPSAVVYDAMQAAQARGANLVIIDTAGRIHTKHNLVEELAKINRVVERELGRPVDEKLLVIDGTTGQNAISQVREFHNAVGVTGLVVTKLDGSAKGGIVLSLVKEFGIPIKLLGVGEKLDGLRLFSADEYAEAMFEDNGN
jgi:fused signal recognition particle receptor